MIGTGVAEEIGPESRKRPDSFRLWPENWLGQITCLRRCA